MYRPHLNLQEINMTNTYTIAERNIAVTSLHDEVHRLCADYLSPGAAPDFAVETTKADIDFERDRSAREDETGGGPARQFTDGYLETLAVCRKVAEKAPDYDAVLFHGSCVAVDGVGYLFAAKSGTGKSTHTRLWRELFGNRCVTVNDDKPLIRISDSGATAYGTPWNGKHRLSTNIAVPLKAICFLERAEKNAIRPVAKGEAYPMLLRQAYRPMDSMAMSKTLTLIDRLTECVSLWRLDCNTDIEAARVACEAMKG